MECNEAHLVLTARLAGGDSVQEWEAVQDHLRFCTACRADADALARTWDLLGALPDSPVPHAAWKRIEVRLPAPRPADRARSWAAAAGAAALAALISVTGAWLLPYERAVRLCSETLRDLIATSIPDPAVFFTVGFLYALLPLAFATLATAGWLVRAGTYPGLRAGILSGILLLPYVVVACADLALAQATALLAGILAGAVAGGSAGVWAGSRLVAPLHP